MSLKSFLAGAAFIAAALPASAITFGQPDGNAHPYVGTLLFERADGYYSCTGTMLSPTVMLTGVPRSSRIVGPGSSGADTRVELFPSCST